MTCWAVAGPAVSLVLLATASAAEGLAETASARAALGEELRELFYEEPDLVAPALGPPPALAAEIASTMYAEEIASDLGRIEHDAARLFGADRPALGREDGLAAIALFVGPDCPDCARAREELAALADRLGLRANVIDTATPADAALMSRLTLDVLPSYAMADKLIRGHMPAIALERYLGE